MPELSRFFGIVIAMYYCDHAPPHFHARYASEQASIRIDNGAIPDGALGLRNVKLVKEWRVLHEAELREDWRLARVHEPLKRIEPLA